MRAHYGINGSQWAILKKEFGDNLNVLLFNSVRLFSPFSDEPITSICLMLYCDEYGDFNNGLEDHKKIARAIFNSMDSESKVNFHEYMQLIEEVENEQRECKQRVDNRHR